MLKGRKAEARANIASGYPSLKTVRIGLEMSGEVEKVLKEDPDIHGFLWRNHSLYTWGRNLNQAKLHPENLELFDGSAGRNGFPGLPMRMDTWEAPSWRLLGYPTRIVQCAKW